MAEPGTVFTLGHSTHPIETFVDLLTQHRIQLLVDVRSMPYSRWQPQYNQFDLMASVREKNIGYVFLGKELGARSQNRECYEDGIVRYDRLARTALFLEGLDKVVKNSNFTRQALVCAEREPLECHRTILIGRALARRGVHVVHIHGDGSEESWSSCVNRLLKLRKLEGGSLFETTEELLERAFDEQGKQIAYREDLAGAVTT